MEFVAWLAWMVRLFYENNYIYVLEELWHCVDCPDKTQNICANCTLKHHATHQLQSYNEYK